jgi:hypothetical protein
VIMPRMSVLEVLEGVLRSPPAAENGPGSLFGTQGMRATIGQPGGTTVAGVVPDDKE